MSQAEEFQKRMDSAPDQWTLAWWHEQMAEVKKGYRGATHAINRCHDDYKESMDLIADATRHCDELESAWRADRAKIGEQQAEIQTLKERLDRMAGFLEELRKERKEIA